MSDVEAPHNEVFATKDRTSPSSPLERRYDWRHVTPAVAVVETVAAARGIDPREVESLYHWIDPHALNRLFEPRDSERPEAAYRISFRFAGYDVTVVEGGTIRLDEVDERTG